MATRQYIGARYVPKFYTNSVDGSTQWEANVVYEPLIYVTLQNGHMYISKKQVPATVGTPASNAEYWLDMGSYNGYIESLQNQIDDINDKLEELPFATPQMYGAKGDGLTDDTSAIEECLNSGKSVIIFPAGIYNVTGVHATQMKDVVILGYGAKLNMTNTNLDLLTGTIDSWVLTNIDTEPATLNHNNGYLEIYGLEIDGNADMAVYTHTAVGPSILACGRFYNYDRCYFKDVYVHHTMSGQGICCTNCNDAVFDNCKAENIGYAALNHPDYIPSTSYEWDALGVNAVTYNGSALVYGMVKKVVFKNCSFNHIAGCSMFGINCENLFAVDNVVEDNISYCIEDGTSGDSVLRDGIKYDRIIEGNVFKNSGTCYGWNTHLIASESLNVKIKNNIFNKLFGNRSSKYITARQVALFYDNTALGKIYFEFADNDISFADTFVHEADTVSYSGINFLTEGICKIKGNVYKQPNTSGVNNAIVGILSCCAIDVEDNIIEGYLKDSPIGIINSALTAKNVNNLKVKNNTFKNSGTYDGLYYLQAPISIGGQLNVIDVEGNENEDNYLLSIRSLPSLMTKVVGNINKASSLIIGTQGSTAATYLIVNNACVGNVIAQGASADAKSVIDNNIDLT